MRTIRAYSPALLAIAAGLTLAATGCLGGRDSGRAAARADAPGDRPVVRFDGGPGSGTFALSMRLVVSPQVRCSPPAQWPSNCLGPTFWYLYDRRPDPRLLRPREAYVARYHHDATHGTLVEGAQLPIRPEMYLAIFIDDDDNALTSGTHVPDEGDLVYVDRLPFSAAPGTVVDRTITFQRRHQQ